MAQYQPMYDSFNRYPDKYVPTARISVSPNVYLPGGQIDFQTGQPKPDHVRRRRTQAKRMEREALDRKEKKKVKSYDHEMKKGGVRISLTTGLLIMSVVFFVCSMVILSKMGQIDACNRTIKDQMAMITTYETANKELNDELDKATDPSVICYHASRKLGMVPSDSVEPIHLSAVDTRPLETARQQNVPKEQTVLPTPIPMTASN